VLVFREKKVPSDVEVEKDLVNARSAALTGKQSRLFSDWIADLRKNSSIEIKEDFLN
jgi:hypothetical protein